MSEISHIIIYFGVFMSGWLITGALLAIPRIADALENIAKSMKQ